MSHVVIAGYARSPFHFARKGALTRVRPDELAAQVVRGLIERTGVEPADLEDVIVGCAFPEGEQGFNVAKIVAFMADLTGSGAPSGTRRGIWVARQGNLSLVAREGDSYEVAPGLDLTVVELKRGFAFNDPGQVAFIARFNDDSLGLVIVTP